MALDNLLEIGGRGGVKHFSHVGFFGALSFCLSPAYCQEIATDLGKTLVFQK